MFKQGRYGHVNNSVYCDHLPGYAGPNSATVPVLRDDSRAAPGARMVRTDTKDSTSLRASPMSSLSFLSSSSRSAWFPPSCVSLHVLLLVTTSTGEEHQTSYVGKHDQRTLCAGILEWPAWSAGWGRCKDRGAGVLSAQRNQLVSHCRTQVKGCHVAVKTDS